jgi:ATP-dependent Clp protease protease subunit
MSEDSPKIPFPQPHFDRLLESRILWVGSDVNDTMAADLCAKMLLLSAEDPKADIYMYLNSPGGSVTAGLSIYDIMELIPNDVVTIATGSRVWSVSSRVLVFVLVLTKIRGIN